mmetsp:Transcript_28266/g.56937  ORF Transcript_28266/g.56937 Transcript_28266/m.56937 type:complete len:156 (+) Transcript_28266:216-683(+)
MDTAAEKTGDAKFNVIVDDGFHSTVSMWNTFAALWPWVEEGGYYIAEDLHGCLHHKEFMANKHAAEALCDQPPNAPSMFMILHKYKKSPILGVSTAVQVGLPRLPVWEMFKDEFEFIEFFTMGGHCKLLPYGDKTSEDCQARGVTAVIKKKAKVA